MDSSSSLNRSTKEKSSWLSLLLAVLVCGVCQATGQGFLGSDTGDGVGEARVSWVELCGKVIELRESGDAGVSWVERSGRKPELTESSLLLVGDRVGGGLTGDCGVSGRLAFTILVV